jgi:carbamoyltransferase
MIKWGMVAGHHDFGISAFRDNKLIYAGFSQLGPWDNKIYAEALKASNFVPDAIVWYESPMKKMFRQLLAGQGLQLHDLNVFNFMPPALKHCPIDFVQHHESHAAYAYYSQPNPSCTVLTMDSIGEFETITIWQGEDWKLKKVYSQGYPHSLGLFYTAMTGRAGLEMLKDEGKMVDLADENDVLVSYAKEIRNVMTLQNKYPLVRFHDNYHRGARNWESVKESNPSQEFIADVTQGVLEAAVQHLSSYARKHTTSTNLAVAGGCAYNRRALAKIARDWDSIHVPPHPGDNGSCVGAMLAIRQTPLTEAELALIN